MNPNTNAWNRIRYGLYAPFYDLAGRRLDAGRRRSIKALDLRSGERVLIPGCGTGLDFDHLPEGLEITAGDISPAMLQKAIDRAEASGLHARFSVMDVHALDLPDDYFDAVLLHLVLAVVPDPFAAIREVARVLKPGGRVGIFDKFLPDDAEASLVRRAIGAVTNVLATDLNRKLGPLLEAGGLVVDRDVATLFGGLFRVVVAGRAARSA